MKKFALCAAVAAVMLSSGEKAVASVFDNDNYDSSELTIRPVLSLDITCPGDIKAGDIFKVDALNSGAGLSFGAVVDVSLWHNLYLESGLKFYYHTVKVNDKLLDIPDTELPDNINPVSASIREFGITIPVLAGYHFDFDNLSLHVFTGPEFSIGLSGKSHASYTSGGTDLSASESIYDDFRRGDIAWVIGAGIQYNRAMLTLSAHPGLVNWTKVDDCSLNRTNVSIGVSYAFNL